MRTGWLILCVSFALADEPEPLTPRASVAPGPYFVGQEIEVRVVLVAGTDRPSAEPPKVAGGVVLPAETSWTPITTSGIGEVIRETRQYVLRFRVVASRPGKLTVPPLTVRAGERSGRTAAVALDVRAIPSVGRPATFLGGVGPLTVEAGVKVAAIRLGQSFDYEIRLSGPGARASNRRPTLAGRVFDDLLIRVEPLPDEVVADPPSRAFRYRLRPGRAGEGPLPPVAVATFDPKSERFQTRVAPAVPFRVAAVATFDASRVEYGEKARPAARWPVAWAILPVMVIVLVVAARALARRRVDPRRLARRLARGLDDRRPNPAKVANSLVELLWKTTGRPPGALTPDEAGREVVRAGGDAALGERARKLIAECDRLRYGGGVGAVGLVAEARAILLILGEVRRKGGKTEGGTLDR